MRQNKLQDLTLIYRSLSLSLSLSLFLSLSLSLSLHAFYGTVYLEILNMSQNKLQYFPLHVPYGTV